MEIIVKLDNLLGYRQVTVDSEPLVLYADSIFNFYLF